MNRRPTPPDEDAVSTVAVPRARASLPTIPDARKPLASAAARAALPSSPKGGMFAETTAHVMIAEETSRTLLQGAVLGRSQRQPLRPKRSIVTAHHH